MCKNLTQENACMKGNKEGSWRVWQRHQTAMQFWFWVKETRRKTWVKIIIDCCLIWEIPCLQGVFELKSVDKGVLLTQSVLGSGQWEVWPWCKTQINSACLWSHFCVVPMPFLSETTTCGCSGSWGHNWHSSCLACTTHLNLPGPQPFLLQILVLTWLGPKPLFLSGMRRSLSGSSVFLRSQLQWVKAVIGCTHVDHLGYTCNSSQTPLWKSHPASSRTQGSMTLTRMVIPPLNFWSLGARSPKCLGSALTCSSLGTLLCPLEKCTHFGKQNLQPYRAQIWGVRKHKSLSGLLEVKVIGTNSRFLDSCILHTGVQHHKEVCDLINTLYLQGLLFSEHFF